VPSFSVVGLVASPRKQMNTDTIVAEALRGAAEKGASITKIYLNDLQIRPCQACDNPPRDRYCLIDDGMDVIFDVADSADAVIVGSPAYCGSISAQLKLVVDRSPCMMEMTKFPDGRMTFRTKVAKAKVGAFIWIADSSRDPGHALNEVRGLFQAANVHLLDTLIVTDADRDGGARSRADVLQSAFELGRRLADRGLAASE
jgi:multimeric flavodoxin WrbA